MKVTFLDAPSLAERIPRLMASCNKLDIAMAYVKVGGLRTLTKNMDRLISSKIPVRIVFGLSTRQGITDKNSAESLLTLSKNSNIDVRKINNPRFHPKLFIFKGKTSSIVIGSSNLTEAAHSKNVEANVLIQDPDAQLLRDVLGFFEYYFSSAPKLKQKDVDKYVPREPRGGKGFFGGPAEDLLPLPLRRKSELRAIRPKRLLKIAPGPDARYWGEWVKLIDDEGEGIIAIGWDVGPLSAFSSYDLLKEAVARKKPVWDKAWGTNILVKYATDQLWGFKTLSEGDVVIVYSESRVLGIARVTENSSYHYKKEKAISYEHQINVKYVWYEEWPRRADDKVVETLGKQGTLRLVKEKGFWNYLLDKLP
jgi:HKD family nuclease